MSPGSLSFSKWVMMSSAPAKSTGGCQIRVPRSIHSINVVPYNPARLQSVLGVRSFYVERNKQVTTLNINKIYETT